MLLQYQLKEDDYGSHSVWQYRNFPLILYPLLGALIVAIFVSGILYTYAVPLWITLGSAVLAFIGTLTGEFFYIHHQGKKSYKRYQRLGEIVLQLGEEEIKEITEVKVFYYDWSKIKRWVETKDYFYLVIRNLRNLEFTPVPRFVLEQSSQLNNRVSIIVPKRALKEDQISQLRMILKQNFLSKKEKISVDN